MDFFLDSEVYTPEFIKNFCIGCDWCCKTRSVRCFSTGTITASFDLSSLLDTYKMNILNCYCLLVLFILFLISITLLIFNEI